MNVKEILAYAYGETNTSQSQVSEQKAIEKLNKIYKKLWRAIVNTQEDYFWNYWTTDIQKGITEYDIQRKEVQMGNKIVSGIAKIKEVQIKSGENYENFEAWSLADNHIILDFLPQKDEEDWLKIIGIQAINELKLTDEEEQIFPWHEDLQEFTTVLAKGLEYELWKGKHDFEKANFAMQEHQAELQDMIRFITQRVQKIYFTKLEY